jgi:hypothetical protein
MLALGMTAAAAPGQASSPLCPDTGARSLTAPGTYQLKIKFEGVIAFVPRGHKSGTKPDGTYEDVVALIPRTDNEDTPAKVFGGTVPPNFYLPWERYPLHHPVVRVRARHFAGTASNFCQPSDSGDCGDHWVYLSLAADDPLRPPSHDEAPQYAAYDVSIETYAPDAAVTVKGFESVPRLLDSGSTAATTLAGTTAAEPCDRCLAFPVAPVAPGAVCAALTPPTYPQVDLPLAARMRLSHGEELSTHHLLMDKGEEVEFVWNWRGGCEHVPKSSLAAQIVSCASESTLSMPSPFKVAAHVVATRQLPRDAPVTLTLRRMSDGCVHRSYLLRPPSFGALEVEVLNLPADGTLDLPTMEPLEPGIRHFNLFHLLAKHAAVNPTRLDPASQQHRFYYPHVVDSTRQDGRPWCSNARFDSQ